MRVTGMRLEWLVSLLRGMFVCDVCVRACVGSYD